MKKKIKEKSEVPISEESQSEESEEYQNFVQGLKKIFSLTPEQAKAIRESPVPPDPDANAGRVS
jgi:hypothetical protein